MVATILVFTLGIGALVALIFLVIKLSNVGKPERVIQLNAPAAQPLTAPAPQAPQAPQATPAAPAPRNKRWLWALLTGLIVGIATYYLLNFGNTIELPSLGGIGKFATENQSIIIPVAIGLLIMFLILSFSKTITTVLVLGLIGLAIWLCSPTPQVWVEIYRIDETGRTLVEKRITPFTTHVNYQFEVEVQDSTSAVFYFPGLGKKKISGGEKYNIPKGKIYTGKWKVRKSYFWDK